MKEEKVIFYGFVLWILVMTILIICSGCSGTGFDKQTDLMPDSVSLSYMQEQYKGDTNAWNGISISATWEFK